MTKRVFPTLRLFPALALGLTLAATASAQNTNTNQTQRTRTTRSTTNTSTTTTKPVESGDAQSDTTSTTTTTTTPGSATPRRTTTTTRGSQTTTRTTRTTSTATDASAQAVRSAFDALIDAISRANVNDVMAVYWDSPQLLLFNNNGTVTRSWAQVKANRASSYPNLRDVKLAVRDVRVQMLGADSALVTCLWTQTQSYKGAPETATGRLSLVFRRLGGAWKIIHTHTSPDRPDPSLLLPSEQSDTTTTTTTTTTRPPAKP